MSALTQMTGYGLPQMALPSMSMPKLSMPFDREFADPEKWYEATGVPIQDQYVGNRFSLKDGSYSPDPTGVYAQSIDEMGMPAYSQVGEVPTVFDYNYADPIQQMLAEKFGWGPKQYKYSSRFGEYLNSLEDQVGSPLEKLSLMYGPSPVTPSYGGYVFRTKAKDGKEYVVEVPHSPGGLFFDFPTSGLPNWQSLGLGDLGGEGNEQIPGGSSASYIPLNKFKGLPGGIRLDDVNPSGSSGLGGLGGLLGAGLSFALGPAGFAMLPAWGAGAIGGGLGSILDGGDPLKGALFGGLGGGLGGEIGNLFSDMPGMGFIGSNFVGPLSPMESLMKGAIGGAIPGAIRGFSNGNPMMGALQGGFAGGLGSAVSDLNPTGMQGIDNAIERGLVNIGSAGLFGGDMEGALLGTAMNAGFAGVGDQLGISSAASGNISSMVQKIMKSNMTQRQKQEALKKIKQQQQMRGMLTNRRMAS